mmetsp:Transcript_1730/g.3880  ORF Transcript_1730/g.3880 Transcript_1730/m.3880 type:complete len:229 (-) Transcript_1730:474-1160(-)
MLHHKFEAMFEREFTKTSPVRANVSTTASASPSSPSSSPSNKPPRDWAACCTMLSAPFADTYPVALKLWPEVKPGDVRFVSVLGGHPMVSVEHNIPLMASPKPAELFPLMRLSFPTSRPVNSWIDAMVELTSPPAFSPRLEVNACKALAVPPSAPPKPSVTFMNVSPTCSVTLASPSAMFCTCKADACNGTLAFAKTSELVAIVDSSGTTKKKQNKVKPTKNATTDAN